LKDIGVARGCTPRAEKNLGPNLQGKVVSAPPGRGRVKFLREFWEIIGG